MANPLRLAVVPLVEDVPHDVQPLVHHQVQDLLHCGHPSFSVISNQTFYQRLTNITPSSKQLTIHHLPSSPTKQIAIHHFAKESWPLTMYHYLQPHNWPTIIYHHPRRHSLPSTYHVPSSSTKQLATIIYYHLQPNSWPSIIVLHQTVGNRSSIIFKQTFSHCHLLSTSRQNWAIVIYHHLQSNINSINLQMKWPPIITIIISQTMGHPSSNIIFKPTFSHFLNLPSSLTEQLDIRHLPSSTTKQLAIHPIT
jgi:hypothetical protein